MQLDYNINQIFPDWKKGEHGAPVVSHELKYSEITLYKQSVCDDVNDVFGTAFKPGVMTEIGPVLATEIHEYLSDKNNHYIGLYGSNWSDLADKYWRRKK